MNLYKKKTNANSLWNITGSFSEFNAEVTADADTFSAENGCIEVKSQILRYDNGVCIRKGKVKNISDKDISLNTLSSKFILDGGEYEVYSQANVWQNESEGEWQNLTTTVSAYSKSIRNACGAAPFMVLWSNQQNRGVAFHLKTYSTWEMHISRIYDQGENTFIEVELGILKDGLEIILKPGEKTELPEIIYYDVLNKTDMDCWKLHNYMNKAFPQKKLPVIYNTWLYKFDRFTYDDIKKQIERASELGVEYFVIDAGWFGEGTEWWHLRGDWEENMTFGFKGRMCEIADEVRTNGMKFGFWIEAECAAEASEIVKLHPDYFFKGDTSYFLDFANEEAKSYILDKTCQLIDKYGAEFVKFDFNADLYYDYYRTGFKKYFKGHCDYINQIRKRYPDLYVENCASGGMRMTVRDCEICDGFWTTDNQSPYYSLRIFKDTILRMPPQWLEGCISVRSAEDFYYLYGTDEMSDKLFATNDATWSNIVSVDWNYLAGFMKGRTIALSFDLTMISDAVFESLKKYISDFKKERDFWQNAVCHILTDTKTILVLEFRNEDFSKVEIVAFSGMSKQVNICVYPVLDSNAEYQTDSKVKLMGKDIDENGIDILITMPHTAQVVKLNRICGEGK